MKQIAGEEWKEIPDTDGLYFVSNMGRFFSKASGRILKGGLNTGGYRHYILSVNGRRFSARAHRVVANLFLPNPLNLDDVNHKDENKDNNVASNLEWCTKKENNNYGTRTERAVSHLRKRVVANSVDNTKQLTFRSISEAGRLLDLDISNISKCIHGKSNYSHVGGYTFKFEEK